MKKISLIIFLGIKMLTFSSSDYPYTDPLVATIVGSSTLMMEGVSPLEDIRISEYEIYTEMEKTIPENFWYQKGYKFSLVKQKKKAPLIFVIAGTGAAYNSVRMTYFQRIFYDAGYNVISISSPMQMNFILNASSSRMPGRLMADSEDIYEIMQKSYEKVKESIEVSDFYVMGYSLGAAQTAYVSYIDEREKKFNFKRGFMINPVVDLYKSATKLDNMLDENIDNDKKNIGILIEEIFTEISKNTKGKNIQLSEAVIYSLFKEKIISNEKMAALIGLAFRIIAIDLNFITDITNNMNVYEDKAIGKFEPLFKYFQRINFAGFDDYLSKLAEPFYKEKGIDKNSLLESVKLNEIEDYLRTTSKLFVVTNRDELILDEKDLKYLEDVFKGKIMVYPNGGHCGNMFFEPNVNEMLNYLKNGVLINEK
ncbi:MAG: serine/threonine protein kinase [Fusobacteriaceae bacterium]